MTWRYRRLWYSVKPGNRLVGCAGGLGNVAAILGLILVHRKDSACGFSSLREDF